MTRRAPIVTIPRQDTAATQRLADVLAHSLGYLVALAELALVRNDAGLSHAAAMTTGSAIVSTTHTVDWVDSGADTFRLTGYANDAASSGAELRYVVNGEVLASAAVPQGGAAAFVGAWLRVSQAVRSVIAGDHVGQLVAVGDGVNVVVLYSVVLQSRTTKREV